MPQEDAIQKLGMPDGESHENAEEEAMSWEQDKESG